MEKNSVKRVKRNVVSLLAETGPHPHQDDLPTEDAKLKRKGKARTAETDRSLSNKEVEGKTEEVPSSDEGENIKFIADLMKANDLALSPSPPTKGDGNCWFRAVAEQVEFLQIPQKARNFKSLRLEVRSEIVFSVLI